MDSHISEQSASAPDEPKQSKETDAQLDPQLSTLLKLCKALHITLNQLVGGVARRPQKGR
jgi:hypothetical protein